METDYRDKIRKLLALAESPVEAEAQAALLKARALMAKHKLSEADIEDTGEKKAKRILTNITFSMRRDPWILHLSTVIGKNYCCQNFSNRKKGKQTRTIGFIGLEGDVELCIEVFKYAMGCICGNMKHVAECNRDSYAMGFITGIKKAFEAQNGENQEWSLVLVMPKEVTEASSDLKYEAYAPKALSTLNKKSWEDGFSQGKAFNPNKKFGTA